MKSIYINTTDQQRQRGILATIYNFRPTTIIRYGTIAFVLCVTLAYLLYPHWITLSDFVQHWYTLVPFILTMLIAILELWYVGSRLHRHSQLRSSAVLLCASAIFAFFIVCVPYSGGALQKDTHDAIAMMFVIFAALGFISIAKRLRLYFLGILGVLMFGLCILEAVFLARYKTHPVYPWVWTILELAGIATMMAALYIIGRIIENERDLE